MAFCHLVGIDVPIVQAPVGGISTPALAAAVSAAGGLGTLSITWRDPDTLRTLLRDTRALTGKPFAVNLVLDWDPAERLAIALEEGVRIVSFFWGDPAPWVDQVHTPAGLVLHTVASAEEARRAATAALASARMIGRSGLEFLLSYCSRLPTPDSRIMRR